MTPQKQSYDRTAENRALTRGQVISVCLEIRGTRRCGGELLALLLPLLLLPPPLLPPLLPHVQSIILKDGGSNMDA
jgi:hypothetical protein